MFAIWDGFTDYLHGFLFGIYPYICLGVFVIGSLIRFDRDQYTWRSRLLADAARAAAAPGQQPFPLRHHLPVLRPLHRAADAALGL